MYNVCYLFLVKFTQVTISFPLIRYKDFNIT